MKCHFKELDGEFNIFGITPSSSLHVQVLYTKSLVFVVFFFLRIHVNTT